MNIKSFFRRHSDRVSRSPGTTTGDHASPAIQQNLRRLGEQSRARYIRRYPNTQATGTPHPRPRCSPESNGLQTCRSPIVHALSFPKPCISGSDVVGEIITPAKDSALKTSQLVFGLSSSSLHGGAVLAEYAAVSANNVISMRDGIEHHAYQRTTRSAAQSALVESILSRISDCIASDA